MGIANFTSDKTNTNGNGGGTNGNSGGIGGAPNLASLLGGDDGFDVGSVLINYNEKFKSAPPTLFRDNVIRDTIGIMIGKIKPNPLLVGPAGSGKTKIVEDIARRLANNDPFIPDGLKGYTVYELPLGCLVAGAGIVGQLEERIKAIIDFATDVNNKAILFIDEIHQLTSNDSQTYSKIAQQLKPAMARSDMRLIGATTTQEASSFLDDPAFARRFSRIIVDELSREHTREIVKHAVPNYVSTKITVSDDVIDAIVVDADDYRYMNNHRPDNALTLLDRAVSFKVMHIKEVEMSLMNDPVQLQAFNNQPSFALTASDVRRTAIRLLMGGAEAPDMDEAALRDAFSKIKGQDNAVEELIGEIRRRNKALFPLKKPATFLFSGPSGVGKTAITRILAKTITGVEPITLNMTEYSHSAAINNIIGSEKGYVGSDSNQELPFDILESNPYQIILLDEFEKCDKAVQRLFMSVFDDGTLHTRKGKTLDFSKSIIIATTNAGCTNNKVSHVGFTKEEKLSNDITSLEGAFDIELLNRFSHKIEFNEISKDVYTEIVKSKYAGMIADVKSRFRGCKLPDTLDDAIVDDIVKETYNSKLGARPAENYIKWYIEENA